MDVKGARRVEILYHAPCSAHGPLAFSGTTAASQIKEAAWPFIEFAMSPAGREPAARLGRTVPSLMAVANSEVYLDPTQAPAGTHIWLDAVPSLRVLPRLENWVCIKRTAAIEFEQAYLGLSTKLKSAGRLPQIAVVSP
ncbi:hypothetical protein GC175_15115 [bacterium]|nr:hypothetical protein [bacterium]